MVSEWPNLHGKAHGSANAQHLNRLNGHDSSTPGGCTANGLNEVGSAAIVNGLRLCRLFRNLDWRELNSVAALTVRKVVPKGKLLFLAGDSLPGFFIVQAGSIKLSRISCEGKEQVMHVFRAGESFGEEGLVLEVGYPVDACALEDSVVLMVQKAGFVQLLRRQPDLGLCVLSATAQHTNDLMNLVADLTLLDVETRLAKWLVADCLQHGEHPDSQGRCCVQLSMTKRVLAAELGTSSETLSRSLAKLSQHGLLAVNGRRIVLLSLTKLARLAEGEAEPPAPVIRQNGWGHDVIHNGTVAA